MDTLQLFLLGNALFSVLSGLTLIILAKHIAQLFGKTKTSLFRIIGVGLMLFSISVFVQAPNPEPDAVFYLIIQDLLWVLVSTVIVVFKLLGISSQGHRIITAVSMVVLFFGLGQSVGLTQVDTTQRKGFKHIVFERVVSTSKKKTWELISDVANYHKIAPTIDSVQVLSGSGKGMRRRCTHAANSWTETATLWEEGEAYSFEVDTQAPDYPYPLKYLKGTWKVEEISINKTKIVMTFDFAYSKWIHNIVLHPFAKKGFIKSAEELMDNWVQVLEEESHNP